MEILERLDASHLKAIVASYRDALRIHQEPLNRLNVYPVPDGDTGTNMALTLESVMAELEGTDGMAEVCKAISHGSLMGARGNSGVILSQILRALAKAFAGLEAAGAADVAGALLSAASAAYAAVVRPVEGTMLTVARAAGEAAAAAGGPLVEVLEAARAAGADALARTPEMLPVLAKAGVVDAGGAGYLLLVEAFLQVAAGRPVTPPPSPSGVSASMTEPAVRPSEEATDQRYEVMFLLDAPDASIPELKEAWAALGNSIVVVGGDGLWNCHIHTGAIGPAIEAALDIGRPKSIRVTDLAQQVEEERWVREAGATHPGHDPDPAEAGRCSVVAVATGDGIHRIFGSLGAAGTVAGGQSMNPSTGQLLEAVEAAPAGEVVILPNNKNIVPVAQQVDGLTAKTVRVVETTSIAEGFAALMAYDRDGTAEENLKTMGEAAAQVVSGEVTRAVRASLTDAGPVEEGDYLGLSHGRIVVAAQTLDQAATALLERLVGDDHEMVTIIEGEGASDAETLHIAAWLAAKHPGVVVENHHGGQLLYPYLFSVE